MLDWMSKTQFVNLVSNYDTYRLSGTALLLHPNCQCSFTALFHPLLLFLSKSRASRSHWRGRSRRCLRHWAKSSICLVCSLLLVRVRGGSRLLSLGIWVTARVVRIVVLTRVSCFKWIWKLSNLIDRTRDYILLVDVSFVGPNVRRLAIEYSIECFDFWVGSEGLFRESSQCKQLELCSST